MTKMKHNFTQNLEQLPSKVIKEGMSVLNTAIPMMKIPHVYGVMDTYSCKEKA